MNRNLFALLLLLFSNTVFSQVNFTGMVNYQDNQANDFSEGLYEVDFDVEISSELQGCTIYFKHKLNEVTVKSVIARGNKKIPAGQVPKEVLQKVESNIKSVSLKFDLYNGDKLVKSVAGGTITATDLFGTHPSECSDQTTIDKTRSVYQSGKLKIKNVQLSAKPFAATDALRQYLQTLK